MSEFEDIKNIISVNLTNLRKSRNITQIEIAEKLNYTDKAVSKWERGESVPDIGVLKQLADFYNITLDQLTTAVIEFEKIEKQPNRISKLLKTQKLFIPVISAGIVWLIATVIFVFIVMFSDVDKAWLSFVYATPVSFIVLLVFNAIWGKKILSSIIVSLLVWSILLCIFLTLTVSQSWLLFLIGVPLQILTILWYIMRIKKH